MGDSVQNSPFGIDSERTGSHGRRTYFKWAPPAGVLVTAGVVLALGIGIVTIGRFRPVQEQPSEEGAKRFAAFWMACLQKDDLFTGLVLTLQPGERPPEESDLMDFFTSDQKRRLELERFYEDRLVQMLRGDTDSKCTFTRTEQFNQDRGEAKLWYRVEYTDPKNNRLRVRVELHLQYAFGSSTQREGWWIRRVVFPLAHDYVLLDTCARLKRRGPLTRWGTSPDTWALSCRRLDAVAA